jgi:hypothetical protein
MSRLGLFVCLSTVLLVSSPSKSLSRTWHVNVDGTGDAATIQAAIDSAGMDDTLLVGPGVYSWSNQGSGNEYGMLHMMRGAPALTIVSEMGAAATILDAEYRNRVFFYQGYYPGTPGGLTIDGFTFTRGLTTQPNNDIGGAFTAHLSSPILRNCVFRGNHADRGGAIWFGGHGWPQFVACVFEANTARTGGALYVVNTPYTVTLAGCVIHGNEASSTAGGIFGYNVPLVVEDCVFTRNLSTSDGGGMTLTNCYPSSVSRCTFYQNGAPSGGGISLLGTVNISVERTIIAKSEDGGAVAVPSNSSMTLSCSDIFGNNGGDWSGPIAGQSGMNGNFSSDPLFCGAPKLDLTLQAGSPCAPGNHSDGSDCGLIGARGVACGGVPVLERSWGAVKALWAE